MLPPSIPLSYSPKSVEGEKIGPAAKALFLTRRWHSLSARHSKQRCHFFSGISDSINSFPGAGEKGKTDGVLSGRDEYS